MSELHLHYLNHLDVQALAMADAEIIAAVEQALHAQGLGQATIEPRMHLVLEKDYPGHFNVLRGYIRPLNLAGVKVVGVRGADIVVEASRLDKPEPKLKTEWIERGACVIPYGTMSAVELTLTDIMDKIVMDDWGQAGSGPFGALRAHVDSGRLSEKNLHAELGQIVTGLKPGRERDDETTLFWHRGLSLSDIALGAAMLEKAKRMGLGQSLRFR